MYVPQKQIKICPKTIRPNSIKICPKTFRPNLIKTCPKTFRAEFADPQNRDLDRLGPQALRLGRDLDLSDRRLRHGLLLLRRKRIPPGKNFETLRKRFCGDVCKRWVRPDSSD
jgi:hypothetical protein